MVARVHGIIQQMYVTAKALNFRLHFSFRTDSNKYKYVGISNRKIQLK